ncbi:vWA domain-containing protein [Bacterioplanoides sp.]|uniref:vWA domain-containing protein n=1 Tax=Bacterioplanoides sp. TaxID=2066072 RepID=UPI003AFF915F
MKYIMVVFAAIFVINFFINRTGETLSTDGQEPPADVVIQGYDDKLKTYGVQGVRNSWPDLGAGSGDELASDLMAANYYVVLDGSGSMSGVDCAPGSPSKMAVASKALDNFFAKLPHDANVGVYAFDRQGNSERLGLGSNSHEKAMVAVNRVRLGGGTPLSVAIDHGVEALTNQARKQLGYGEYHMVVVTDGTASPGYEPDESVERLLKNSPIVLHTIGFCISDDHSLNMPGYTLYKSADNLQALTQGLESVLAESPDFNVDGFSSEI